MSSTGTPGTHDRQSANRRTTRRHRRSASLAMLAVALVLITGCAARGGVGPGLPVSLPNENHRPTPRRAPLPDTRLERSDEVLQIAKESISMTRRLFLERVTPVAVTLGMLIASPVLAFQEAEGQAQNRPIVRPPCARGSTARSAGVRTSRSCFFGTAKPAGAVT